MAKFQHTLIFIFIFIFIFWESRRFRGAAPKRRDHFRKESHGAPLPDLVILNLNGLC
jgi:hypothetical protein